MVLHAWTMHQLRVQGSCVYKGAACTSELLCIRDGQVVMIQNGTARVCKEQYSLTTGVYFIHVEQVTPDESTTPISQATVPG